MESRILDLLPTRFRAANTLCSWKAKMVNNAKVQAVGCEVSRRGAEIQNPAYTAFSLHLLNVPRSSIISSTLQSLLTQANSVSRENYLWSGPCFHTSHSPDFSSLNTRTL